MYHIDPVARNYLLYISQDYSFEILRPLRDAIIKRGDHCAWFIEGEAVNRDYLQAKDQLIGSIGALREYNPDAVFVPGNVVPAFIPGLKVQVFHGLECKKKSHFRIRGFFDLYCTHGPITTSRFNQLAKECGHFHVVETGWPKLDPLFQSASYTLDTKLPVVLFAPTFSPNLTCAVECFEQIEKLVKQNDHYWLVKFHPKMKPEWQSLYKKIKAKNFKIVETDSCLPLLRRADILISDTSSIIGEFLLLDKPAVTFKNVDPGDYLINISSPEELSEALLKGLNRCDSLLTKIRKANQALHPYSDGQSSNRILDAVESQLDNPVLLKKGKPYNLFRSFKLRKKLNYWKW